MVETTQNRETLGFRDRAVHRADNPNNQHSIACSALGPSAALCAECAVVAGVARRFTVTELARTARIGKRALEYDGEPPRADANG